MELTDMVDMVLAMLDTDMEPTHMPMVMMDTHMLMVDTEPMVMDTHTPMDIMERDPLMLSQRLMLMLLFCTELMDMVVLAMPVLDMLDMDMDTHMLMVDMDTHMPMVSMESKL